MRLFCKVRAWAPLIGLTLTAFVFNTSEFIPIGLLSDIARDFGLTEAETGVMITIYAWCVALLSLPLMLLASRVGYRKLLLWLVALFGMSHLLSAVAPDFGWLIASRIGVAAAHSVFWSIVPTMAVSVAPGGNRAAALSGLVAGGSIALIVGLPMGRVIGLVMGWRTTFGVIAAVALAIMLYLAVTLPETGNEEDRSSSPLAALRSVIHNRTIIGIYIFTALLVTGHFTAYSYIEPFMGQVAGMSDRLVTATLLVFGMAGLVSSWSVGRHFNRHPMAFIIYANVSIPLMMLLLLSSACCHWAAFAVCFVWGMGISVHNIVFQNAIITQAPHASAIAMSIYSGIYNLGIGSGALVGGMVCDNLSIADVGIVGAAVSAVASVYCIWWIAPRIVRRF